MLKRRPCPSAVLALMIVVSACFRAAVVADAAQGPIPFHNDLGRTDRPLEFTLNGAAATRLAQTVVAVAAASPADEKLPPNWLVQVGYVARQDARPQDMQRIAELEKSLAGLEERDPKRAKIERDLVVAVVWQ